MCRDCRVLLRPSEDRISFALAMHTAWPAERSNNPDQPGMLCDKTLQLSLAES
jgi:hypothetical protein